MSEDTESDPFCYLLMETDPASATLRSLSTTRFCKVHKMCVSSVTHHEVTTIFPQQESTLYQSSKDSDSGCPSYDTVQSGKWSPAQYVPYSPLQRPKQQETERAN